ncbi:kinesin light chain-like protein [Ectocarpus siliculosus]|uniref:Kinesin light chain-like protein n=1 Tax=Ectocarpus siliculosus TaxID=2880 RepID=D8LLM3_ECTSI|nr:kinesin light chain-like protein [Ectocarpus siliculosus]|eukprot:CBN74654.1 kinesin light chain-like protein [Ectocarpus siliculosus]
MLLPHALGEDTEADPLYLRAIEVGEKKLGPDHPDLATWLNNQAVLLRKQGKYDEAGPLYRRSLAIDEKVYGRDPPDVATNLNNLARLFDRQCAETLPLCERSPAIQATVLDLGHLDVAQALENRV